MRNKDTERKCHWLGSNYKINVIFNSNNIKRIESDRQDFGEREVTSPSMRE